MRTLNLVEVQGYGLEVEHAHLYLAFFVFDADLEDKALFHVRGCLETIVDWHISIVKGVVKIEEFLF